MIRNGKILGKPLVHFRDTKANIEALTGLVGGEEAHATDTGENGYYDEVATAWVWGGGGGTGGSGGAYQRVLSSALTLADGESLIVSEYINAGSYDIALNGDSSLFIL